MPSGALGIWYAKNAVTSPRTIIPNSVGPQLTDSNMLMASRRRFSDGIYWGNIFNALTRTEGVAAPDGSLEATSIVAASGTNWDLSSTEPRVGAAKTVNGQTYTAAVSVKFLGSGTASFRFGDSATGLSAFTATTSWQRFTKTYVATGASAMHIAEPVGGGAANFAICDLELFAGSADLHPTFTKPGRVQNIDWECSGDTNTVVTGGAFKALSLGLIHLDQARNLNPFTLLYLTKHTTASPNFQHEAWVSDANGYSNFVVGKVFDTMQGSFNGSALADGAVDGSRSIGQSLWGGAGLTAFVGAARYNGTAGSQFINGVKLMETTATLTGPTVSDLSVGFFPGGDYSGYDIYAMAFYNRALSDAEMVQATKALIAQSGVSTPARRIIYFQGTSISYGSKDTNAGIGFDGYAHNSAPNLSPIALGYDDGVPGSHLSGNGAKLDAIISSAIANGAPFTDFVLHLEFGANDTPSSALASQIAAYCDARKAANPSLKIVVATILPNNSAADGGAAFNSGRAVCNPLIRGFVGVHCDAVSDFAADPTIGPDSAANNTTYFDADKIHPTHAGHLIMEPIARAAINSI